eukprot:5512790-Lingulodinium_polyedra.AAC.1
MRSLGRHEGPSATRRGGSPGRPAQPRCCADRAPTEQLAASAGGSCEPGPGEPAAGRGWRRRVRRTAAS